MYKATRPDGTDFHTLAGPWIAVFGDPADLVTDETFTRHNR